VSAGALPTECPVPPEYSVTHTDPTGDFRPHNLNPDLLNISVDGNSTTVCLRVTLSIPADPTMTDQFMDVEIGFDIDETASTGMQFGTFYSDPEYGPHIQCSAPGAIGADRVFNLRSGELREIEDSVIPWASGPISSTSVPVVLDGNNFTVVIPVSLLGSDTAFHFEVISREVNAPYYPASDCAPNGASLRVPDGAIVPPQDLDGDGRRDWLDNCPGLFNPTHEDTDFDWYGDACDATPTHEFDLEIRTLTKTVNLKRSMPVRLHGIAIISNWSPWSDEVGLEVEVAGLPEGCRRSTDFRMGWDGYVDTEGFHGDFEIAALSQARISWSVDLTCGPETSPGRYNIDVTGMAKYPWYFAFEGQGGVVRHFTTPSLQIK
jgi:hypothetical protein